MYSQEECQDYLVNKEGDTIYCKVLGLKREGITYIQEEKKSKKNQYIFDFSDIKILDFSIIENPLNIKIEEPDSGFAHVYFYRPYVYTGSALSCKIEYNNGEQLKNIKTNSYFLHKVKSSKTYKYYVKNN